MIEKVLLEMVERIRLATHPDRIVLFGSRGRDAGYSQSDYDLLVVAPSDLPRGRRTVSLYRLLAGVGVPKDIVWWTPEEVADWQGVRSHFISTALREGKVLYEKPA